MITGSLIKSGFCANKSGINFREHTLKNKHDVWSSGDPYEYFMGRWSKLMAPIFLNWLDLPGNIKWLDLGCGTGALSESIYINCNPTYIYCVDPSEQFLAKSKIRIPDKADFLLGTASDIPLPNASVDVIVSGLALNFFPDLDRAIAESKRVLKKGSILAAYVWDYYDRMDFLRIFWDAVCEVDPTAIDFDEGIRFPICNFESLEELFIKSKLTDVEVSYLNIHTKFENIDDYWAPFLGGQGPAPTYLISQPKDKQDKIREMIIGKISFEKNGSFTLLARALAIRGTNSQ